MVNLRAYGAWVPLSNCTMAMLGGGQPHGTRPRSTSSIEHLANRPLAVLSICLYWMKRSQRVRGNKAMGVRNPQRGELKVASHKKQRVHTHTGVRDIDPQ